MKGFTLVELMAVLFVVGLAGAAVLLTLPDGGSALRREAEAFGTRLARAGEEAVLSGRAVEVTVSVHGYGFTRRHFDAWQPLEDGPFRNVLWQNGTRALLPRDREQIAFHFDPVGGARPQSLVLARDERRVRIAVDPAGKVRVDE